MALSSTSRPSLRAKVLSRLPATFQAAGGLKVSKTNGRWTLEPDWTVLALEGTLVDPENRHIWTLDPVTGEYKRLSVQALIDALPTGPTTSVDLAIARFNGTSGDIQDSVVTISDAGGIGNATSVSISGNLSSAAWTTNGVAIKEAPRTLTDTSSSGTVAAAYTHVLGGNTIAASAATTFTKYATLRIKDPLPGTNVTIGQQRYSLELDSLKVANTKGFVASAGPGEQTFTISTHDSYTLGVNDFYLSCSYAHTRYANGTGNRQGLHSEIRAIDGSVSTDQMTGGNFQAYLQDSGGGTSTGIMYALSGMVQIDATCAATALGVCAELDTYIKAPSVARKIALQLVDLDGSVGTGSFIDAALYIAKDNSATCAGWANGVQFGAPGFSASGVISNALIHVPSGIKTPSGGNIPYCIEATGVTFDTSIFAFDNFTVSGNGNTLIKGSVSIGSSVQPNSRLYLNLVMQGTSIYNLISASSQIKTGTGHVDSSARYIVTTASTDGVANTLPAISHFYASQGSFGSTTVTTQYGFRVDASLTGATTNYGIHNALAAASGVWGYYGSGSARNYSLGAWSIGGTTDPGTGGLYVAGATSLASTLTIAPSAANAKVLGSTGGSNTGSDATSAIDLAWTLNTSGSPDVIALRVTDTARGAFTTLLNLYGGASGTTSMFRVLYSGSVVSAANITAGTTSQIGFNARGFITSPAAGGIQFGGADVSSGAVAQTLSVQNNTGAATTGPNFTIAGAGGTTIGGSIVFQTKATTTAANALELTPAKSVVVGSAAIATNATDGFLYIPTCAGTPTGTPTSYTGRVALVYDTTNNKLYVYNGAWKGGTAPGVWS